MVLNLFILKSTRDDNWDYVMGYADGLCNIEAEVMNSIVDPNEEVWPSNYGFDTAISSVQDSAAKLGLEAADLESKLGLLIIVLLFEYYYFY